MYRRIAGLALLGAAALFVVRGAAVEAGEKGKTKPAAHKANYVHTVIFYLKKGAPAGEVQSLIEDSHKMLGKIPSVRGLWVGRPAEKATPKVAITDFQVGLLVLFEDAKGLQTYLDHPQHLEYVAKHSKYWDMTPKVYDFVNRKK